MMTYGRGRYQARAGTLDEFREDLIEVHLRVCVRRRHKSKFDLDGARGVDGCSRGQDVDRSRLARIYLRNGQIRSDSDVLAYLVVRVVECVRIVLAKPVF
jgi:hypothetical protein